MGYIKKFIYKIFYKQKIYIQGKNNILNFSKSSVMKHVKIEIYGSGNSIFVGDETCIYNTNIKIGFPECPINNCDIYIGKNSTINSANILLGESESNVIIYDYCMLANDVDINCCDEHSILNENDELTNAGISVYIGYHVWLGKRVTVMKNSIIPDGCIVGACSLVAKKFDKENCVIAGNPAKIVKENIHWDSRRPEYFLQKR